MELKVESQPRSVVLCLSPVPVSKVRGDWLYKIVLRHYQKTIAYHPAENLIRITIPVSLEDAQRHYGVDFADKIHSLVENYCACLQ